MREALDPFFTPKTIAVVGASNTEGKMGNLFVRHLLDGFPGKIFPVHPTEKKIAGLTVYPNISAVPEPVDLVIPLIPGEFLNKLMKSCPKNHVKFLLAISSGFGEVPNGGKELEEELIHSAKEKGIRVVGPNTAGMFNCLNRLNASMIPDLPKGNAGFSCITQSGGFGMAVYMYTQNHQLEMAKLCDLGNTADVTVSELLDYLVHDNDTRIIGAYLESVPNEEAFFNQACEAAEKKPFILTQAGRTPAGQRASFAHIGGNIKGIELDKRWEASGKNRIIQAQTGLELLNIAKGMSWQPLPKGKKVEIITGSGGVGAELTDLCVEHGLEVPEFSQKLQDSLRPYLPSFASVANPVDLTPLWWQYYQICPPLIRAFQATDEVDILILTVIDIGATQEKFMHALRDMMSQKHVDADGAKPIFVFWSSTHKELENMRILEKAGIPCYSSTMETVKTVSAINCFADQSK